MRHHVSKSSLDIKASGYRSIQLSNHALSLLWYLALRRPDIKASGYQSIQLSHHAYSMLWYPALKSPDIKASGYRSIQSSLISIFLGLITGRPVVKVLLYYFFDPQCLRSPLVNNIVSIQNKWHFIMVSTKLYGPSIYCSYFIKILLNWL